MIYPERLYSGDTIGIVAPSSPASLEAVQKAIPFFENMGLHVKFGKHLGRVHGYLAGTDRERLADLHDMIGDPQIKAVIFARGGYGAGRIVPDVDYEMIRQHPKIIWGYSDITYLHTAIRQATDLVTFHGPMPASDIAKDDFEELSKSMFKQLFEPTTLIYSEKISPLHVHSHGHAAGELVGGNLSLIASTIGTPYEIETRDKILLLEDIGEEPYRVDGLLNQLKLSGKLSQACGIVIGDFAEAEPTKQDSLTLEEVFRDYFQNYHGPVMAGFKIGHCLPHFSVPLGSRAELSTKDKRLKVEPGVR
ncbi:S66 peptidase family protein [Virgibacillus ainsalahensis]